MGLKNPKNIEQVVEKLMISCICAVHEQMQGYSGIRTLDDQKEVQKEYNDYLKHCRKEAIELIKLLTKHK